MAQPIRPEPKFFLDEKQYGNGRSFYEDKYFSSYPLETRYLGEKSTSYIESSAAAQRIHDFYPDARVVIILRDPVLRAWSNYRFSVQNGLESLDFESAIAAERERIKDAAFGSSVNPYAYRRRGQYMDFIEDYLKVFDSGQLYVVIFEEIVGSLTGVQSLYRWLGVDNDFSPAALGEVFNPADKEEVAPTAVLRDLAFGYQQSLERLEKHLGRPISNWRRSWEAL